MFAFCSYHQSQDAGFSQESVEAPQQASHFTRWEPTRKQPAVAILSQSLTIEMN